MTDSREISKIWAGSGGETDPGDAKIGTGWIAEIPTFQNMNYLQGSMTRNILSIAERGVSPWDAEVTYQAGAVVEKSDKFYFCRRGGTGVDPDTDTTNSYWVEGGAYFGTNLADSIYRKDKGVYIDRLVDGSPLGLWLGSDVTVKSPTPSIALETTATGDNLLLSNISGELCLVNVGSTADADGRDLNATKEVIYHTGNFSPTAVPPASTTVAGISEYATDAETIAGTSPSHTVTPQGLAAALATVDIPDATVTVKGKVELATNAEAEAGTDTTRAVTPAGVRAAVDDRVPAATSTVQGKVELATDAEAISGISTTHAVTPASLAAALAGGASVPDATTSVKGKVELATDAETATGTDTTRAVTPAGLASLGLSVVPSATTTVQGKVELATNAEAIAGTSPTLAVTPASLAAVTAGLTAPDATTSVKGISELATNAETITGTDTTRTTTPAGVKAAIGNYDAPVDGNIYGRQNSTWVEVTGAAAVSSTPPNAPTGSGEFWYNLENGRTYLDVNDGSSSQWADVSPPEALEVVDASPTVKGKVELATNTECIAGTDTERAVTPAGLAAATLSSRTETVLLPFGRYSTGTHTLTDDWTNYDKLEIIISNGSTVHYAQNLLSATLTEIAAAGGHLSVSGIGSVYFDVPTNQIRVAGTLAKVVGTNH